MLPGCASMHGQPSGPEVEPWSQRLPQLQRLQHFDVDGRMAVSNGTEGFSAGLRWQQNYDQTVVDLSAPLGFGAAHIQQTDGGLRVTTSKGVALDSEAANEELRTTLGFDAPLRSLRYWLVGASDPATPAQETLDSLERLVSLEQDGWKIDYGAYTAVKTRVWLPSSLIVTRESLRLKIVIHDWRLYSVLGD